MYSYSLKMVKIIDSIHKQLIKLHRQTSGVHYTVYGDNVNIELPNYDPREFNLKQNCVREAIINYLTSNLPKLNKKSTD